MTKFSVKKPLTIVVAVILVIILGVVSFTEMQTDLLPSIDLPYAMVMTSFPGASPEEVEQTVSKPVEQSMATINNIKNISSISNENVSIVILEFSDEVNMDSVSIDIREKLDLLKSQWDNEMIGNPSILKMNPNMLPVMVAAVDVEGMSNIEISDYVSTELLSKVESIEGVATVNAQGLLEEKLNVVLDQDKIDAINDKIAQSVDQKFEDAKKKLEDAENEITSGKEALSEKTEETTKGLVQAQQKIDEAREALLKQELVLENSEKSLYGQKEALIQQEDSYKKGMEAYQKGLATLEQLKKKAEQLAQAVLNGEATKEQAEQAAAQATAMQQQLTETNTKLIQAKKALDAGKDKIADAEQKLSEGKDQIAKAKETLNQQEQELQIKKQQADSGFSSAAQQLESAEKELAGQKDQISSQKDEVLGQSNLSGKITADMISNILKAQNFSMPAGYISQEGRDYLVRVGDKLESQKEAENLVLFDTGVDGVGIIHLSDVADVFMTDNSSETYAKVNGNNAVILSMNKQTSYSTSEVSQAIKEKMEELMEENPKLHTTYLMDQGMYINVVVNSVLNNLIIGAFLAVIILLLFLRDIRPTLIIACSIPISVIFAFVLMYFSGVTLNIISLSGLAVGVGMLVDNSVVVIENIYRLRNKGVSKIKAAVTGATQVAGAIVASTLTTICVFLPIVFVKGLTRQLFVDMGLTIGYSLVASLIVALTLVPAMSANLLNKVKEKKHPVMDRVLSVYEKMLRFCLKRRALVLLVAAALLVGSVFGALQQGTAYMPKMDGTQISVSITMPQDATMEEAVNYTDQVIERIQGIKDVETVGGMIGSSGALKAMGGSKADSATLYVILKEDKQKTSEENAEEINKIALDLPCEVRANGSAMDMSAMGGSGISLMVKGEDMETLKKTAREVADLLRTVKGTKEVSDGIENPDRQIQITVDKNLAAEKGLTVAQVYAELSKEVGNKKTATTLHIDSVDYPVIVLDAAKEGDTLTPETIGNYELKVTGAEENKTVKLSEVSNITIGDSLSSIRRSAQRRYLNVTAAIEDGYNIGLVSKDVEKVIDDYKVPKGFEIVSSGENDTINDAIHELTKMLLLAVAFIYLIMVAQFQSLLSPFIVMFTIPLAFTGGFLGLFFSGKEISTIAMIGFVLLSGIIVNNGIVLVDYINQLRRSGMEKKEALIEAGKTRMRPILMTALTTVFGLVSMAFGLGMGGGMVQPIAIVTIGGLLYATLTTLFVIPVLYDLFHHRQLRNVSEEELEVLQEKEE